MKNFKVIGLFLLMVIVLVGCQNSGSNSNDKKQNNEYKRIISLIPSNTEILYELGLGDKIVGVSTVDDYPKDVKNKKQFDAFKLDTEALLKAKPDLVLSYESNKQAQQKDLDKLSDAGVKVVYINEPNSINEMYDSFKEIGKITNKEKEAKQLVSKVKNEINEVVQSIPQDKKGRKVFMEISSSPEIYTAGSNTFYDDMLTKIDAKNIFHGEKGWIKIDKETILDKNPDVMIDTSGQKEKDYKALNHKREGFNNVEAIKNDRIYSLNADLISRPGPRLPEGMKQLVDKVYKD